MYANLSWQSLCLDSYQHAPPEASCWLQVMADGRDRANPTLHIFDPLGSTLHATNQRAYAITFVGEA